MDIGTGISKRTVQNLINKNVSIPYIGHQMYNITTRKHFFDATQWATQIVGDGTPVFDSISTFYKFSNISLRVGNVAGASTLNAKKISLDNPIDMLDIDFISIWVYVDGLIVTDQQSTINAGNIMLVIGDLNFVNSSGVNIMGSGVGAGGGWHKGWNNLTFRKSDFTTVISGTLTWGAIQSFQIRTTFNAAYNSTKFHFNSIFIGGKIPSKIPVCITLDDSNKESIDMAAIMNEYGIPVSLFVIDTFVDNPAQNTTYMTLNECKMMYDKGNHIGMHGDLVNEYVVAPSRIKTASEWLRNNGFIRDNGHLYGSYPNGSTNQTVIDYAKSIGVKGLRSLSSKISDNTVGVEGMSSAVYDGILNGGIADPYRILSDKPTTLASFTANLDIAINKKGAYITYHHTFSEVGTRAEWVNIAKYLKTKIDAGVVECLTFPQFCQKYDGNL